MASVIRFHSDTLKPSVHRKALALTSVAGGSVTYSDGLPSNPAYLPCGEEIASEKESCFYLHTPPLKR